MSHTLILLACMTVGWGLAVLVMRLAPRLQRWGDRRAFHQLALFSPLLTLILAGGWSLEMALTGCLQFTTQDGVGTIILMTALGTVLGISVFRESWRIRKTRINLEGLAVPLDQPELRNTVIRLAGRLGVKVPGLWTLPLQRPLACVAGVQQPSLFVSSWVYESLEEDELEALAAHELAHLRHLDNLLAWLDVVVLQAFAFLPPMHHAWRESLAEREEAADVIAATITGNPLALASALLKVAEWRNDGPSTAGAASFNDDLKLLERRIERLLAFEQQQGRPWGLPAAAAAATALALPVATAWTLGYATSCLGHF